MPTEQPVPLPITRLEGPGQPLTVYSGLVDSMRTVVRDDASWRALWTTIWRRRSDPPPLPLIDFTRDMVVVAALGERPTGGYGLFIESALETSSGVTIQIRALAPGARCATTQALTQPVDAARVPRREVAVVFQERTETLECP